MFTVSRNASYKASLFGANVRSAIAAVLLMVALIGFAPVDRTARADSYTAPARTLLRRGDQGSEVILVQHALYQMGYVAAEPDGSFGPATQRAVKSFQSDFDLAADGVVGPQTWNTMGSAFPRVHEHTVQPGDTLSGLSRLYGVSLDAILQANAIADPDRIRIDQILVIPFGSQPTVAGVSNPGSGSRAGGSVELLHWTEANPLYPTSTKARVIDVETGRAFHVQRYYGSLHADSEPVTAEDAQIMNEIFGGWSWERRAIIVEIGGRRIAASMNGQPHGSGGVEGNGFAGHFCIHFLGSRLHLNGKIDPDHHAKILEAAGYTDVSHVWLEE